MAAEFTLPLMTLDPFISMLLIGVFVGTKGGTFLEDKAEKLGVGGIVLITIRIKILVAHTLM